MRLGLVFLVLFAACSTGAAIGERGANDSECARGGLCEGGRCRDAERVQKARAATLRDTIEDAREKVEAAGLRAEQAGEAFEADRTPPDAGPSGGGVRSTASAEKKGAATEVHREDYQRNAVGKAP